MLNEKNSDSKLINNNNSQITTEDLLNSEDTIELNLQSASEKKSFMENNKVILEDKLIINESFNLEDKSTSKKGYANENRSPRKIETSQVGYIEEKNYSEKSWGVTLVFCVFLGFIGFHRFYVGKAGTAILMLFTLGGFGIWSIVDLITIIISNFTDEEDRIIKRKKFSVQH